MIIDCISDLHGYEPQLPGGDLLLLAGDYTAGNKIIQWNNFFEWLINQPYRKKILIAGNHDGLLSSSFSKTEIDFEYLCDSGTKFEGLNIWGTPWTPWFHGVNPACKFFMANKTHLEKKFKLIPENIDILITHGPMFEVLDENKNKFNCGSYSLKNHINRSTPKFHICGHIHEQGNKQKIYEYEGKKITCINCSYVNEEYEPCNSYVRISL